MYKHVREQLASLPDDVATAQRHVFPGSHILDTMTGHSFKIWHDGKICTHIMCLHVTKPLVITLMNNKRDPSNYRGATKKRSPKIRRIRDLLRAWLRSARRSQFGFCWAFLIKCAWYHSVALANLVP